MRWWQLKNNRQSKDEKKNINRNPFHNIYIIEIDNKNEYVEGNGQICSMDQKPLFSGWIIDQKYICINK